MKGIAWGPNGPNEGFDGTGHLFATHVAVDAPLMAAAHINTVRTYGAPERTAAGRAVLDTLYANGIMVVMTVFAAYGDSNYTDSVNAFKDHPAVLAWLVGNEWNYKHLYSSHSLDESATKVGEVIRAIQALDPAHPVGTVYGEIPSATDLARVPDAQFWGSNIYSYLDFGTRFDDWKSRSTLPLFVSEYGADAYHQNPDGTGQENQADQAFALEQLTPQIRGHLSASSPSEALLGGCPFEWNDEWWKAGAPATHDSTGNASGGVYSDHIANEEWWGVVDAQRTPRQAYRSLQTLYTP
jgi:beta-galactosidase/beta-glucuronidase